MTLWMTLHWVLININFKNDYALHLVLLINTYSVAIKLQAAKIAKDKAAMEFQRG